jgi:hypothetical protein
MHKVKTGEVSINSFVLRQTPESPYSHYSGEWLDIALTCRYYLSIGSNVRPGYRDGVLLVDLSDTAMKGEFFTSIVQVKEGDMLWAHVVRRRAEEEPYVQLTTNVDKSLARHVDIVLYKHDLVDTPEIDPDGTTAEWQVIAILARDSVEELPVDPVTMARNFLQKTGGTKGVYTAEQFAQAIWYWKDHALAKKGP